ncbi:MAG: hypothetical protein ACE5NW_11060 [Acidiferrobacterales bacterium]
MEQRFLAKLDGNTQRLVQEIEDFATTEVQVRPTPTPSSQLATGPKAVALLASETGATLLYRDEQTFQPQAVLHELLHLHRYWNECVPQLLPLEDADGDKTKIAHQIENTLEHLVITPKESEYGFESYERYNQAAKETWERYPWSDISEPWARRKNCLLGWLAVNFLVTDTGIKTLAEQTLKKEDLLDEAQNFSDKLKHVLNSKERCIGTTIRFLRIPRHEATMVYLDVRNRGLVKKPIPEH